MDQEVGGSKSTQLYQDLAPQACKVADDDRLVDHDDVPATGREVEGKPAS